MIEILIVLVPVLSMLAVAEVEFQTATVYDWIEPEGSDEFEWVGEVVDDV